MAIVTVVVVVVVRSHRRSFLDIVSIDYISFLTIWMLTGPALYNYTSMKFSGERVGGISFLPVCDQD